MSKFIIETRQKAERLFETAQPLDASGSIVLPVREVRGYAEILLFGVSDQPFGVNIEEAPNLAAVQAGRFVQTEATILSTVVGSFQQVKTRVAPLGSYMRITIGNLAASPMTVFDFLAQGLPLS